MIDSCWKDFSPQIRGNNTATLTACCMLTTRAGLLTTIYEYVDLAKLVRTAVG